MTAYRTCHNCALANAPCARRAAIAEGLSGLNVTSVKFRCAERVPLFTRGQRVTVTWNVPQKDEPGYEDWAQESWPATVIAERGSKFQIVVDDVDSDEGTPARSWMKNPTLHAKVTVAKLQPLNEPARDLCLDCDGVVQPDGTVPDCWNGDPPSRRCINRARQ